MVAEGLLRVVFSRSGKLDVGLLHTKQQTIEFIQRSGIYGTQRTAVSFYSDPLILSSSVLNF